MVQLAYRAIEGMKWGVGDDENSEDMVNHPPHYEARNGMESMDWLLTSMTEEEKRGYLKGNVLKYLWRYEHKGKPVEDLDKAIWYLNKLREIVASESQGKVWIDDVIDGTVLTSDTKGVMRNGED